MSKTIELDMDDYQCSISDEVILRLEDPTVREIYSWEEYMGHSAFIHSKDLETFETFLQEVLMLDSEGSVCFCNFQGGASLTICKRGDSDLSHIIFTTPDIREEQGINYIDARCSCIKEEIQELRSKLKQAIQPSTV